MEKKISIEPVQNSMNLLVFAKHLSDAKFNYMIPEAIGSTGTDPARGFSIWGASPQFNMAPQWQKTEQGWKYTWKKDGLLKSSVHAYTVDDHLDVHIRLQNLMDVPWPQSQAFSCFNPRDARIFADFEGTRTFLLLDDRWTAITRLQRKDSPRPTIQLWYVKDQPRPLGFVETFQATPPVYPRGVLAVRSRCEKHLIAVTADKPLFLFNNLEFSCIHCCPAFGALKPGEEGHAFHRVFICKNTGLSELTAKLKATWA